MTKNKYGLFTCISMIVGVVIGSGIFFKSDNILIATNGNILLGAFAFCIAAISIIFGSLTIAELAARTDKPGGIITYAEDSYNGSVACSFGWFQVFLYYPTLIAVVSYVVGIYTCMLFGLNGTLEAEIVIGFMTTVGLFMMNLISSKLAGYFQSLSAIIKLIPLFIIGILGFVFGKPAEYIHVQSTELLSTSWLSALVPIVFAFDGWIVATTISHKVEHPKRNVPIALVFAPLFILAIYLLYFIGISIYVGPETIMHTGDAHVNLAATQLFGNWGAKALLIFVIISVAGTANGLIIALIQLPYSLAIRNMFPYSKQVAALSTEGDIPLLSGFIAFNIVCFWSIVHYITMKFGLLPNSDVSEISITVQYVVFILLYIYVLKLGIKGEIKSFWKGKFNPIMAMLGSIIILLVGMQNPLFWFYILLCTLLFISSYVFWKKKCA